MKTITTILALCCALLLQAQDYSGTWNTNFGELRLIHEGNKIYGDYKEVGIIDAAMGGDKIIRGDFTNNGKLGQFTFTMSADGKSFTGKWWWFDTPQQKGDWTGSRKYDSWPTLKMAKWTGLFEFKVFPSGFTEKLTIKQKGFSIEGQFDEGGTFNATLDHDLKTIKSGVFYYDSFKYILNKSYIKNNIVGNNIPNFYGTVVLPTKKTKKFFATFLKPMSVAEFKSRTY